MNCEQIASALVPYLLKDLPEAEHETVRKHLEDCESCRASVRELKQTLDLLDGALAAPFDVPLALDETRRAGIYGAAPVKKKPLVLRPVLQLVAVLALLLVGGGLLLPSLTMSRKSAMTQAGRAMENMELAKLEKEEAFAVPRGQGDSRVKTVRSEMDDYESPMMEDIMMEPSPPAAPPSVRPAETAPVVDGTVVTLEESSQLLAGRSPVSRRSGSARRDGRVIDEFKPDVQEFSDGDEDFGSVDMARGLASVESTQAGLGKDRAGWGKGDDNFDRGLAKMDAPLEEHRTPGDGKRSNSRYFGGTSGADTHAEVDLGKSTERNEKGRELFGNASGGSGGGGGRPLNRRASEMDGLSRSASEVDRVVGFDSTQPGTTMDADFTYAYHEGTSRFPGKAGAGMRPSPNAVPGPDPAPVSKPEAKKPVLSIEYESGILAETEVSFSGGQNHMARYDKKVSGDKETSDLSARESFEGERLARQKEGKKSAASWPGAFNKDPAGVTYTTAGTATTVNGIQFEDGAATAVPDLPVKPLPPPENTLGNMAGNGRNKGYSIQPGDTLSAIAKRKNTSVEELAKLNRLSDPNAIRAGQELVLPGGEGRDKNQKIFFSLDDSDNRGGDEGESREQLARVESKIKMKQNRDRLESELRGAAAEVAEDVSEEEEFEKDAISMLGGIPLTGHLFKSTDEADYKDERVGDREEISEPVFRAYSFNPYIETKENAFSTFSIDVDTAAYTLARRYMVDGSLPPPDAVRTEEFLNFFNYNYPAPKFGTFAVYSEAAPTPLGSGYLLKVGIKGKRIGREEQRKAYLTFVIDTSGSMDTKDRLGLARKSLKLLVDKLSPQDQVAIVQYSSQSRLMLEHTPASQRQKILEAIDALQVAGSTHLEQGLTMGYQVAARVFDPMAINRVLLVSDGAANLGAASAEEILNQVESYRKQGIFCSIFGFGIGTYNDVMLETLANKGNGSYQFIDSEEEARRVFVDDLSATLNTIASDVKIQVEFNSERVQQYRQLGYENRQLTKQQFRDDTVDAGEVGSGQSVTALYEIHLQGDPNLPLGTVRVRYRNLDTGEIEEIARPISAGDVVREFDRADSRFRLAAAVATFAEKLRGSPFADHLEYRDIAGLLRPVAMELELDPYVQELSRLVQAASNLPRAAE